MFLFCVITLLSSIKGLHKRMAGFKASTEENLVKEKGKIVFYFTIKTQEFHMGCMTYNVSEYGHHLSPYKCLCWSHRPVVSYVVPATWAQSQGGSSINS